MAIPRNLANLAPKLSATGGSFATTIGVGGATPAASGAGITFPADQTIIGASSDANTLDDYEEGTFTPAYAFATSGSVTYGTQEGRYTKVGRLVTCNIALGLSAVSSPTGNVTITGLPFATGSSESSVGSAAIGIMREFANAVSLRSYKGTSSTTMILEKNATNAGFTALAGSDLASSTLFYLTVTYQV